LIIFANFGGVPCIRMATRNNLPPAQTKRTVNNKTPIRPAIGCQIGMLSGVAIRRVINIGVNGGINDIQVENALRGSLATGMYINMGIIAGKIIGNVSD
jgi:hypothetical protein